MTLLLIAALIALLLTALVALAVRLANLRLELEDAVASAEDAAADADRWRAEALITLGNLELVLADHERLEHERNDEAAGRMSWSERVEELDQALMEAQARAAELEAAQ